MFFHDRVGLSWGLSIIALTVVRPGALMPLTVKQFKSMQALQQLAPQMKELQAKYKDDKQRQQQEMMKFYQENKVNPFGLLPAAGRAAAGLHLAVLHAAQGPAGRHLPADRKPADVPNPAPCGNARARRSSSSSRTSRTRPRAACWSC